MTKNRRGQAALEFLTTYGWAFLVMLIVIAALAYFGFLDPSNLTPRRCTTAPEVGCRDFIIEETATANELSVRVAFVNQIGSAMTLSAVSLDTSSAEITGTPTCSHDLPLTIAAGAEAQIYCNVTGSFPPQGDKQKFNMDVTYKKVGGSFAHNAGVEVYADIQP